MNLTTAVLLPIQFQSKIMPLEDDETYPPSDYGENWPLSPPPGNDLAKFERHWEKLGEAGRAVRSSNSPSHLTVPNLVRFWNQDAIMEMVCHPRAATMSAHIHSPTEAPYRSWVSSDGVREGAGDLYY